MQELKAQVQGVIEVIRQELKRLNFELTSIIPKELEKSRSYGDLNENAEYHSTKERQSFVESRVSQLNRRLSELTHLNLERLSKETVGLFSQVQLEDDEGNLHEYAITLPELVSNRSGGLSVSSPRARTLLGKAPGDRVRFPFDGTTVEAEVLKIINPWGEEVD